jgi:serine/threonine protein kinase
MALEHAGARTLRGLLDTLGGTQTSSRLVAAVGLQVARALGALHTYAPDAAHGPGFVHRDVTPSNLLLADDGLIRLVDLGLARRVGGASRTATGVVRGKHAYLSPEQILRAPVDARTDLHALGAILRELATGIPAYGGDDILDTFERIVARRLSPLPDNAVEPRLAGLFDACLATDPAARPPGAEAVVAVCASYLGAPDPDHEARAIVAEALARLAAPPSGEYI